MSLNTFSGSNITYTHNLGNKYIVTDLYDTGGLQIAPNSLTANTNNVQFDFTFPTEGWVVVKAAEYSQSFTSATSVNVSHSLGTDNIILNVFDTNDVLITPDTISLSGSNNAIVDFTYGTSGYVTVVQDDYTQSFSSVTQSAITHGLGTKNILVSVYDNNDDEVVPDGIDLINDNTASITFTSNTSGKAVVVNGYTSSYVIPSASIYIGNDTISVTGSTCIPITVGDGFTNIYSWTSRIAYDASLLNFVGESNDFLGVTIFNPTPGQLSFIWTAGDASGSTFVSGSNLFSICFEAVATGSASLYFTGSPTTPPEILSSSLQEIPGDYYSGSIIVQALPPTPPPPPPPSLSGSFDYLVVGGGGAGGLGYNRSGSAVATGRAPGGGGGAGGFVTGSFSGSLGLSFDITVGNGGTSTVFSGSNFSAFTSTAKGSDSEIDSVLFNTTAFGGGYGGLFNIGLYSSPFYITASVGGSGGGGFPLNLDLPAVSGTVGQGNAGAKSPNQSTAWRSGGGGGAGSAALGAPNNNTNYPLIISGFVIPVNGYSPGGSGSQWIDGNWYAGGGGGGTYDERQLNTTESLEDYYIVSGGIGGGGNSETGNLNGTPNTGGGGGGGVATSFTASITQVPVAGGNGGSGIVKFRYPVSEGLIFDKGETIISGGYYFTTFTASVNDVTLVTATGSSTLYLYQTSSEAEYFDILWGSSETGPWTIVPSGSNVPLGSLYSYTVNLPSNATYLKLMNKNPLYFPDNFRIHPVTFGEPAKGVVPVAPVEPPNLIQSMSGEITVFNGTPNTITVTNLYLSSSVYQQNAFMPPSVTIGVGSSSVFTVQSLPTTGSPVVFPDQIELGIEISGNEVSNITGSWIDIDTSPDIYEFAWFSGSQFDGTDTNVYFYLDTKPTFTSESQVRIIGQAIL